MYKNKQCFVCNDKSDSWTLFSMLSKHKKAYFLKKCSESQSKSLSMAELDDQWICVSCSTGKESTPQNKTSLSTASGTVSSTTTQKPSADNDNLPDKSLSDLLVKDTNNAFHRTKHAAIFLLNIMPQIETDGYVWRKDLTRKYKEKLVTECLPDKDVTGMCQYFDNYLTSVILKTSEFSHYKAKQGTVIYNNTKHTEFSVGQVVSLLEENAAKRRVIANLEKHSIQETDIQKMFDEQVKMFSDQTSKLDYRNLKDEHGVFLGKFIHRPLFDFFMRILKIKDAAITSEKKKESQYLRLLMGIGIFCNIKNRYSLIMQTVIGLAMYPYGLRDSGFHVLNRFGLSCSIKHIRRMAKSWSSQRKCIDEISIKHMWRVTFDNLNFSRKFAKTNRLGGEQSGRMLDLLTGQVSHRSGNQVNSAAFESGESPHTILCNSKQFRIDDNELEKVAWNDFLSAISDSQQERNKILPENLKSKLIQDLEQQMPDYTPDVKDTISYATVKEAKSSSINDIAGYLHDLKTDLYIGLPGYPSKVVLAGDQQTYSLVKNLMKKYPDSFDWIIPMIGDWHLLKLASECIKSILWDGGLHQLGMECGHLKEIFQWRDIHNLLIAVHEGLLSSAVKSSDDCSFSLHEFISKHSDNCNKNQVSNFWASILHYLNAYVGYYFAIRSGNFALRNACLPKIAELFFAYNHGNYQKLVCEHIVDLHNLPPHVKEGFYKGQWTMSVLGRKFHNVALDEGHEGVINKRLKQLTSRSSEYRTVTLSDFMAYLDKFVENLHQTIFKQCSRNSDKNTGVEYVRLVIPKIANASLFRSDSIRSLRNVFFGDKAPTLDDGTITDLLSISSEGKSRMDAFISSHYVQPRQNTSIKKRKLSTFSKKATTQYKEKQKTNKVTLLLKRAYAELQKAGHYIEKTVAFPLAICNEDGEMRGRIKSKILHAFKKMNQFCSMFLSKPPFNIGSSEVIIDFLKFIHEPTPPDIGNYKNLALYYWKNVIMKYGFSRGVSVVTLAIDKAAFLPSIRQIVHSERNKKVNQDKKDLNYAISDNEQALPGTSHMDAVKDPVYKKALIQYLQQAFLQIASQRLHHNSKLIIDCVGLIPTAVINGFVTTVEDRTNNKGEADNAIFVHAMRSDCNNILIVAEDTDIIMYGIAALETGYFKANNDQHKNIAIEKEIGEEYVWINKALENFVMHDSVQASSLKDVIGHSILAIYLLAGSDYLSNFFGITCEQLVIMFLRHIEYVSPKDDPLIVYKGEIFESISHTAFSRLLCCVYLEKYKRLTSHIASSSVELFETFKATSANMNAELKSLLEWLAYDANDLKLQTIKITNIQEWTEFTRRVCFFMNQGSKNLYQLILPSNNSIKLHCNRGSFVMRLALELGKQCSDLYEKYEEFGWLKIGGKVHIIWDENFEEEQKKLNSKRKLPMSKCSCKTGCKIDGKGCTNCTKSCKPCSSKCACKGVCQNPHNKGGDCSKCRIIEEELEELKLEESQSEELLTLPFHDLDSYFDMQKQNFIDIPTEVKDTDTDSDSDYSVSEDSDTEL
jgi:hypothetical protein